MPEISTEVNAPKSGELVSVATFLPVRRWLDVIPFLRMSSKVSSQLKKSEAIRFGLKTDLLRKKFWTLSVWPDMESMRRFNRAEPHATAIRNFSKWAGEGAAFVEWKDEKGAIDWAEAFAKLENPTFRYRR